jgi:hypothetical protein
LKAAAKPTEGGESSGNCPKSTNLATANNVGASFENDEATKTTTYKFESFINEHPVGGVPGLIKYCVFPTPTTATTTKITPLAHGDNGALWTFSNKKGSGNFSFTRPGGNASNIGLDGTDEVMGTATWASLPTGQTIVLHINDEAECHELYGPETSVTCFVLPGKRPGPRCGAGDETVAFNNYPFDIIQACPPATAFGVQANHGTLEYGNGVLLAAAEGEQITKLTVPFYSFACGTSGHWNTGATEPCVTSPGAEFEIPANPLDPTDPAEEGGVLARLYEVKNGDEVGEPLGEARYTGEFPYRPSADSVKCTGTDVGKWFNAEREPPRCQNFYGALIPFDFSGVPTAVVPVGKQVIWTVSFNTESSGYAPFGAPTEGCPEAAGCGYDSLNIGADSHRYVGAPYAGADMDVPTLYYKNAGGSSWPEPQSSPEDPGEAPLAQITTAP